MEVERVGFPLFHGTPELAVVYAYFAETPPPPESFVILDFGSIVSGNFGVVHSAARPHSWFHFCLLRSISARAITSKKLKR